MLKQSQSYSTSTCVYIACNVLLNLFIIYTLKNLIPFRGCVFSASQSTAVCQHTYLTKPHMHIPYFNVKYCVGARVIYVCTIYIYMPRVNCAKVLESVMCVLAFSPFFYAN